MRTIVLHLRACNSDGSRRSVKIEGVTGVCDNDGLLGVMGDRGIVAQFNIEEVEYWRDVSKDRTAPYVEPPHNCDTCKYVWQAPDAIC